MTIAPDTQAKTAGLGPRRLKDSINSSHGDPYLFSVTISTARPSLASGPMPFPHSPMPNPPPSMVSAPVPTAPIRALLAVCPRPRPCPSQGPCFPLPQLLHRPHRERDWAPHPLVRGSAGGSLSLKNLLSSVGNMLSRAYMRAGGRWRAREPPHRPHPIAGTPRRFPKRTYFLKSPRGTPETENL